MMTIKDPIHLQEPGGLAEVDVGANSISAAPFVNDDQAESLDVGEVGLVQIGVDQGDGLARKGVCRSGRSAAIATDEGRRAPVEDQLAIKIACQRIRRESIESFQYPIPLRSQATQDKAVCVCGLARTGSDRSQ